MKLEVEDFEEGRVRTWGTKPEWGPGGEPGDKTPVLVDGHNPALLMVVSNGKGFCRFERSECTGWIALDRIDPRD